MVPGNLYFSTLFLSNWPRKKKGVWQNSFKSHFYLFNIIIFFDFKMKKRKTKRKLLIPSTAHYSTLLNQKSISLDSIHSKASITFQQNNMNTAGLQTQLLEVVQKKFVKRHELIRSLSELLSVSADGIYRRLRGETILSPEEVSLLARTFKISVDRLLFGKSDSLLFSFNLLNNPITNFRTYVEQIYYNLLEVSKIEGTQIYYASQEIPIFQYFTLPKLASFKLYVYGLTSWNLEYLKGQQFHLRLVDPEVLEIGAACTRLYNQLHTKDLWNLSIIDNTLSQIEYLAMIEQFEQPNDALQICEEIIEFLEHANKMAAKGRKLPGGRGQSEDSGLFDLYYNEMITTNTTILVRSPLGKMAYTTMIHPNFIHSSDQQFCQLVENWFDMIMSRSISISVHSAKSREWYFNRLKKKALATKEKIKIFH